jgi:hypothetical protein
LLITLALTGCGGSSEVSARKDGSLTATPPPITVKQIDSKSPGSPERAIYQLWFWAQWGSLPNVVLSYHPHVRAALGPGNIAGGYKIARGELLASRPRIVAVRRGPAGVSVGLEVQHRDAEPTRESFLLRRGRGGWLVVYDTLLERQLSAYAQQRLEPSKTPSGRAALASHALAARYRNAAVTQPLP